MLHVGYLRKAIDLRHTDTHLYSQHGEAEAEGLP